MGCPEWCSRGSGEVVSSSRCPKSSHMCYHRGNGHGMGSARLSPCGQGHLRGCPHCQGSSWPQEKGMGGLVVLLAAGGFTGHRLESKLSFQRDTRIPAPRARATLCKHHNCQTRFLLLSSWACSISPFSNRYQLLSQKITLPVPAAMGSAPDPLRQLPERSGTQPPLPATSGAKALETTANVPGQRCRVKHPFWPQRCTGAALKKTTFESIILMFWEKPGRGEAEGKPGFAVSWTRNVEQLGRARTQNIPNTSTCHWRGRADSSSNTGNAPAWPKPTSGITREGKKEAAAFTKPRMLFISAPEKNLENI